MDAVENKIDSLTFEKKINDKERPKLSIKSSSKFNSFNESDSSTKSSAESVDIKPSTEFPLGGHYVEDKSRSLTSTPSYLSTKPPLSPPINYGSQTLEKSVSNYHCLISIFILCLKQYFLSQNCINILSV